MDDFTYGIFGIGATDTIPYTLLFVAMDGTTFDVGDLKGDSNINWANDSVNLFSQDAETLYVLRWQDLFRISIPDRSCELINSSYYDSSRIVASGNYIHVIGFIYSGGTDSITVKVLKLSRADGSFIEFSHELDTYLIGGIWATDNAVFISSGTYSGSEKALYEIVESSFQKTVVSEIISFTQMTDGSSGRIYGTNGSSIFSLDPLTNAIVASYNLTNNEFVGTSINAIGVNGVEVIASNRSPVVATLPLSLSGVTSLVEVYESLPEQIYNFDYQVFGWYSDKVPPAPVGSFWRNLAGRLRQTGDVP